MKPLLLAACLALSACAGQQHLTPAQAVYSIESDYGVLQKAAITYKNRPDADPAIVAKLRDANHIASDALTTAEAAVRAGQSGDALTKAQAAIDALRAILLTVEPKP